MKKRHALHTFVILLILMPMQLAANLSPHQQTYLAALDALNKGKVDRFDQLSESLTDYILTPYLEYERLRFDQFKDTQGVQEFLARYPDQSISHRLKQEWLLSLPVRGEWDLFLSNYDDQLQSRTLHCYYLRALYRSGEQDKALAKTADAWVTGNSSPKACDPLFRVWLKSIYFTPEFAYERVKLALAKGHTSLASYATNFLKGDQQKAAAMMVWVHKNPSILASTRLFPSTNRYMKDAVIHGLERRVRWRPDAALGYLKKYESRFEFTADELAALEKKIYLGLARQYDKNASSLLESLSASASSREVLEWQIRVSLRERDWPAVLKWIEVLEKNDDLKPEWYYWKHKAYIALKLEVPSLDEARLEKLAQTRTYYGFLTAELLGKSLTLTNMPLPVPVNKHKAVESLPEIDRAKEFLNLGYTKFAQKEWQYVAYEKADQVGLMSLAKLAYQWGWYNHAITAVINADHWHDLSIRFPTPHQQTFAMAAHQVSLESSWLFAIARQESAFAENARSSAGARGLMQLMPATARQTAKKVGLKPANNSLYDPEYNIQLGASYLSSLYGRFNNNRALATAAYNAGPHRVTRWIKSSAGLPIDVWIETIPYDETRRYVKNVLAFDAIYQHKLGEKTPVLLRNFEKVFVSELMLGQTTSSKKSVAVK